MYIDRHSIEGQRSTLESELRRVRKEAGRLADRIRGDRSLLAYYQRENDRLIRHLKNLQIREEGVAAETEKEQAGFRPVNSYDEVNVNEGSDTPRLRSSEE